MRARRRREFPRFAGLPAFSISPSYSFSRSRSLSLSLTYRGNERGGEGIVREAEEYAGLADAGVADEQQLEQQIVRLLRHFVAEAVEERAPRERK